MLERLFALSNSLKFVVIFSADFTSWVKLMVPLTSPTKQHTALTTIFSKIHEDNKITALKASLKEQEQTKRIVLRGLYTVCPS